MSTPSLTLIRARRPAVHTIETNPSSSAVREQHDLLHPRGSCLRGRPGEQLGADAEAAPRRRDLDGELAAVGQREGGDPDDVAPDHGPRRRSRSRRTPRASAWRAPGPARGPRQRTPPAQRSAAARECSVALHFSGCGPSSFSSTAGSSDGSGHHVVRRGEPPRRLVDQVVSGAGFDAHLVPACTTHELGDRPRGPVLGSADHQLVGHPTEVGKDLQAQDVQARLSAPCGEQRKCPRAFGQRRAHPEEHGATVASACCGTRMRPCFGHVNKRSWLSGAMDAVGDAFEAVPRTGSCRRAPLPGRLRRPDPDRSRPDELPAAHGRGDAAPARRATRPARPRRGRRVRVDHRPAGPPHRARGSVVGVELVPELAAWGGGQPRAHGVRLGLDPARPSLGCSGCPSRRRTTGSWCPPRPLRCREPLVDQLADEGRLWCRSAGRCCSSYAAARRPRSPSTGPTGSCRCAER